MTFIAGTGAARAPSTRSCGVCRLLQKHKVEYNVLACVGRETAKHPLEVYRFFRDEGVEFIQFTPVVERAPDEESRALGLHLASPAPLDDPDARTQKSHPGPLCLKSMAIS